MEELRSEDLEELVQELEEEYGAQESPPQEVEELLRVLQSGSLYVARWNAAEQLGKVDTSSPRIMQALLVAWKSDTNWVVRDAAAKALSAPVHNEFVQQHPELIEATEQALQQHSEDSIQEMLEELEEEQQSGQEPLSPDVEELLRELESGRYSYTRSKAARQLGRVDTSSPRIVQALLAACEPDAHYLVREAAAKALSAPVHQEWLQNHPRLLQVAEGILQRVAAEAAEFALRWQHSERCDRTNPTNSNLVVVSLSGGIILLGIGIAGLSGIISRANPALVLVSILAGVVLVASALWIWLAPSSARNVFLRTMKETVGTVEDLRKSVSEDDFGSTTTTYYVTVRFKADDANMGLRVLALEAKVARGIWNRMKRGNTIGIQYAAEDPRIALIEGEW